MRTLVIALVLAVAALGCGEKGKKADEKAEKTEKTEKAEEKAPAEEAANEQAPAEEAAKEEAPAEEAAKEEAPAEEAAKEEAPAEVKLAALDLAKAYEDVPVTITAPEGATAKEAFGVVEVRAGDGFQLQVSTEDSNGLAALKAEHQANTMNKLKRFVQDTPEVIFYESEIMGRAEFHFAAYVKLSDEKFVYCEDNKGPTYTEAQVKAMLDACLTAKPNG